MEASISNPPFEVKKLYIFQHFSLLLLDSRQKLLFHVNGRLSTTTVNRLIGSLDL
jgi:hypothetical protein